MLLAFSNAHWVQLLANFTRHKAAVAHLLTALGLHASYIRLFLS